MFYCLICNFNLRSAPCCTFTASFCMACVILLFAVLVEKATICQQARAQKVTEFTPQQREQRGQQTKVITQRYDERNNDQPVSSLFPLLWCKFCNLLCACLLAAGYFLHRHSKQKNHTRHTERSSESTARG